MGTQMFPRSQELNKEKMSIESFQEGKFLLQTVESSTGVSDICLIQREKHAFHGYHRLTPYLESLFTMPRRAAGAASRGNVCSL